MDNRNIPRDIQCLVCVHVQRRLRGRKEKKKKKEISGIDRSIDPTTKDASPSIRSLARYTSAVNPNISITDLSFHPSIHRLSYVAEPLPLSIPRPLILFIANLRVSIGETKTKAGGWCGVRAVF